MQKIQWKMKRLKKAKTAGIQVTSLLELKQFMTPLLMPPTMSALTAATSGVVQAVGSSNWPSPGFLSKRRQISLRQIWNQTGEFPGNFSPLTPILHMNYEFGTHIHTHATYEQLSPRTLNGCYS